ncbi:MAG: redoxin domain-containing protein [Chloroflexi bacterium]|nr:redoxin domain-containing protein [Chloroflexota bacterium]
MRRTAARALVLAAAAALTLACVGAGDRADAPAEDFAAAYGLGDGLQLGERWPELRGLGRWYNSPPLTLDGLAADRRVVLIDFWTYTCVNCLRTLPFLKSWHEKYGSRGLTIIGVHSPEFDFERREENVAAAVARDGIRYAVVHDDEMETWRAFRNRVWPAKYLLDPHGFVRFVHFGEGEYDATERQIRDALVDNGWDLSGVAPGGPTPPRVDPKARSITRELYGGYGRNYLRSGLYAGQEEYYLGPDRNATYRDEGVRQHHRWYLEGVWRNEREAVVHARETRELEDYIVFRFQARSVNVVMHPAMGRPYDVYVELDGKQLTREQAGADVFFDERGRSLVRVTEPRMYAVVELRATGDRELRLRSDAEGFSMYAVTFGNYEGGA